MKHLSSITAVAVWVLGALLPLCPFSPLFASEELKLAVGPSALKSIFSKID